MRALRRGPLLALGLMAAAAAQAQLGGSLAAESDYRFRGVSLNRERPDLRLTLSYEHTSGAYAGVSATRVEFEHGQRGTSLLGYVGFSGDARGPWRWDAGATVAHASNDARYDYGEAYLGLLGERSSLRLSVAPDYFGSGKRSAYLEADAGWPLSPTGRLFAHLGALSAGGTRWDARLGLAARAAELEVELAWVGVQRRAPYAPPADQHATRLVLSTRWSF